MTFYQPCRNCMFEKGDCDRRNVVRAGIKGLHVTSLKFRCKTRRPLFRAGQRVAVTWKVLGPEVDFYSGQITKETWPATVIRETAKGFVIAVDNVDSDYGTQASDYLRNENLFCNVAASKLAPLGQSDRRICRHCWNPEDGAVGVAGGCWNGDETVSGYYPDCLLKTIEAERAQ